MPTTDEHAAAACCERIRRAIHDEPWDQIASGLTLTTSVGVAFDIYFVMRWREGQDNPLQSSTARAILFSALTTGTAFGSLALSNHPGTSEMGKLLTLALGYTLLCTFFVLPALLGAQRRTRRERRRRRHALKDREENARRLLGRVRDVVGDRARVRLERERPARAAVARRVDRQPNGGTGAEDLMSGASDRRNRQSPDLFARTRRS